jgi:hypothetical protein
LTLATSLVAKWRSRWRSMKSQHIARRKPRKIGGRWRVNVRPVGNVNRLIICKLCVKFVWFIKLVSFVILSRNYVSLAASESTRILYASLRKPLACCWLLLWSRHWFGSPSEFFASYAVGNIHSSNFVSAKAWTKVRLLCSTLLVLYSQLRGCSFFFFGWWGLACFCCCHDRLNYLLLD